MDEESIARERRKNDEDFKAKLLERVGHIERTLFDEEGNSNLRLMQRQQMRLHQDNSSRLEKLERAMFDESGNSRLRRVEGKITDIADTLGKSKFLGSIVLGLFTIVGPALSAFISWFLTRR